jgi:hypothetical protein
VKPFYFNFNPLYFFYLRYKFSFVIRYVTLHNIIKKNNIKKQSISKYLVFIFVSLQKTNVTVDILHCTRTFFRNSIYRIYTQYIICINLHIAFEGMLRRIDKPNIFEYICRWKCPVSDA